MSPRLMMAALIVPAVLAAAAARAETSLSFAPADNIVGPGQRGALSIYLDDPVEVRSILVWVEFDPAILASLDGLPGQVFLDVMPNPWLKFRLDAENRWYGEVVILGADLHGRGPGQLFSWKYEGTTEGTSPIVAVDVRLFAPDGTWISDTVLPPTTITVGDPTGVPSPDAGGASLRIHPNPFNPATRLSFSLPGDGPARLTVFDLRGRRLGTLWDGPVPAGSLTVDWNGCDASGRSLAGGVYVFRLEDAGGVVAGARGLLLE